jgi:hypothetical protein
VNVLDAGLRAVARSSQRAERRLRLRRALDAATRTSIAALVAAVVLLALRKTGRLPEMGTRLGLAALVLAIAIGFVRGWARRLPVRAGAIALDRHHHLADRLASALAFSSLAERTPFMDAAIADAVAHGAAADPRRAVPLTLPRDLPFALVLAAAFAGLAFFEVRRHELPAQFAQIDAVDVTPDDLDAMRDFLHQLDQTKQNDDVKAAVAEFNQLIEDLAAKRLDRTEAFRKMQALEDRLLQGREGDAKALEDALAKIGDELKKSELTKAAGEALDTKNLAQAQDALKELAKKLREQGARMDKKQLEQMRQALKNASERQAAAQKAIEQRREELKKDLLQKKQNQPDGGDSEQEKSLLQKKERELERLDREAQQAEQAGRQLDRLDRELSQAAEDLMKDLGVSAQDLEQSAEDLNRMAKEEMTDEQKEELKQKIEELRETIRQQGQGGQGQMARLRRFQSRAHGQQGQGQGQQGQGQQGQGQEGQEGQGQQGQGQNGQGQQGQNGPGQQAGQNGQGQGQQGQGGQGQGQGQGQNGQMWVVGPNGEKILMLSRGSGQGSGQGQGQGQSGQGGQAGDKPGQGAGTGHNDHVEGSATNAPRGVGTQDTQIAGQDTGQGGSRSEVIQAAAERGFATHRYEQVYRDYKTVAEEALEKDEIPGGYRFYVRRYFQLIRPRDGEPSSTPVPGAAPNAPETQKP